MFNAKAYAAAQNTAVIKPPSAGQEDQGLDFGSMVKSAMNDVMHNTKKAEGQIAAWQQQNPGYTIVRWSCGYNDPRRGGRVT